MLDLCSCPPVIQHSGVLLVGHDEHAVPVGFGLVEQVVLAALPESARGAIVRPALQQFLENYLGLTPLAGLIAGSAAGEHLQARGEVARTVDRSEEHTSELHSRLHLVCRLLLLKKKKIKQDSQNHAMAR